MQEVLGQLDELRFAEAFGRLIDFSDGVQSVETAVDTAFLNGQPANSDAVNYTDLS